MSHLPDTLTPDPRIEAIELALELAAFALPEEQQASGETDIVATFLLLDAAADPDIPVVLGAFDEPSRCLFDGKTFEDLGDVGPWLSQPRRYGPVWDWFVEDLWGRNIGVMVQSALPLLKLKTRLKTFLRVEDEEGEAYFFKYFRPRHLLDYVPAFTNAQRLSFFRDIRAFLTEDPDEEGILVEFQIDQDGALITYRHDLAVIGEPLIIQPPSPEDAAKLIAAAVAGTKE